MNRKRLAAFTASVVAGIGCVSGAFQVFAIPGGVVAGTVAVAAVALVSGTIIWRPLSRRSLTRVAFDAAFAMMASSSVDIRCVFSAGDEMRQALEGDILGRLQNPLQAGTTVRLVCRERPPGEMVHVADNLSRIRARFAAAGVTFQSKSVKWDYFMIGGLIFDSQRAAVKFYYRTGGSTAAIDHRFALINASRGGYERFLFDALSTAFESLWSS